MKASLKKKISKGNYMCSQCGNTNLVSDLNVGEKLCGNCGLVVSDKVIDRGREWRAFSLQDRAIKERTGAPTTFTYYDKGLYTSFRTDRDVKGNTLKPKIRLKMQRLKRHDMRSKLDESGSKNLLIAMTELNRLSHKLHVPKNVNERAAIIYRNALEKNLTRGRTIVGCVAASLYAACRQAKIPRSLQEVSEASTESYKHVSMMYRLLLQKLELKMPVDHPMKYVPKIAAKVGVSRETERLTIEILWEARNRGLLIGKNPQGVAAASLYLACKIKGEKCTQKAIATAAETNEVTLRNRLKDIKKMVDNIKLPFSDNLSTIELKAQV